MSYSVPNAFASQSGNVPASQLDGNNAALLTGINNTFLTGTLAGRPAPDGIGNGRYYFATDNGVLYRDNGAAWVQVAAGNIASALDYSTGTWTPTVGGTATYTLQNGVYTKFGRLVHVGCNLIINAIGTGSATTVSGLPFTSAGGTVFSGSGPAYFVSAASNIVYAFASLSAGSTSVSFVGTLAAGPTVAVLGMMGNGTQVAFSFVYST